MKARRPRSEPRDIFEFSNLSYGRDWPWLALSGCVRGAATCVGALSDTVRAACENIERVRGACCRQVLLARARRAQRDGRGSLGL